MDIDLGSTVIGNNANINDISAQTVNQLSGYTNQIKFLWIIIISIIVLVIIGILIYNFFFKGNRYRILIHMPNGDIQTHKLYNFSEIIKIDHKQKLSNGEKDIFDYLLSSGTDNSKAIKTGKIKYLQYFYRNPNPIIIDQNLNKCSTKAQNIDQVIENDIIQKFVLARDLVGLLKTLAIITLVIVILVLLFQYFIYQKPIICEVLVNATQGV